LFPIITAPEYFMVTLIDASANREIVKVTARTADSFSITRGEEGTVARVFAEGSYVSNRVTAGSLDSLGAPGGSDTQIQYNDATIFGGSSYLTFSSTTGGITNAGKGTGNLFVGTGAGNSTMSGTYNVLLGDSSGTAFTSGSNNNAIGRGAMGTGVVTGSSNNALGYSALANATSGGYNNAIGYLAMGVGVVTGSSNNALGYSALANVTSGYNNNALGQGALLNATIGSRNNALGYRALASVTSGYDNNAFGQDALTNATSAGHNNAIGYLAMGSGVVTGSGNNAIGQSALVNATSATNNNAIGYQAGHDITTGHGNILIGYDAGHTLTTGDNNIIIGHDIDPQSITTNNQLSIGNLIFANGGFGTGTAVGAGNVGVLTPTPHDALEVNGALRVGDATAGIKIYRNVAKMVYQGIDVTDGTYNSLEFTAGAEGAGVYISTDNNIGIGTLTFGAAADTVLTLSNGAAPGALTNTASLVSLAGELWAYDQAANATQLSSHPQEIMEASSAAFPYGIHSKNAYLGKEILIDITALVAAAEGLTGKSFHVVRDLPNNEKRKWSDDYKDWKKAEEEKQIAEKMKEEVEVAFAEAVEEVEIVNEEKVDSGRTKYKFNKSTGKIDAIAEKETRKINTGQFIKQLKSGHRIDENTGKVYRRKTREEVESSIVPVIIPEIPKWMKDRGVKP